MPIPICLDDDKQACGCDILSRCGCGHEPGPFTVTGSQLRRMTKRDLLALYTRTMNDEMSPIKWRGFTKARILKMFLGRRDSVELTPFRLAEREPRMK